MPNPTKPNDQKLLTALRNASAWLQTAANVARLDGREEMADAIFEEGKAVFNLMGRMNEKRESVLG